MKEAWRMSVPTDEQMKAVMMLASLDCAPAVPLRRCSLSCDSALVTHGQLTNAQY